MCVCVCVSVCVCVWIEVSARRSEWQTAGDQTNDLWQLQRCCWHGNMEFFCGRAQKKKKSPKQIKQNKDNVWMHLQKMKRAWHRTTTRTLKSPVLQNRISFMFLCVAADCKCSIHIFLFPQRISVISVWLDYLWSLRDDPLFFMFHVSTLDIGLSSFSEMYYEVIVLCHTTVILFTKLLPHPIKAVWPQQYTGGLLSFEFFPQAKSVCLEL